MRSNFRRSSWPAGALVAVSLLCLTVAGCRSASSEDKTVHEIGKSVSVGDLSYIVYQAEWRDELPSELGPRKPQHRFLLVTVSIANNGPDDANIPLLAVIGEAGKETLELDKGEGVPQWFGVLRRVRGTQTEHGVLLFDVPPGNYTLRISNGGDVEREKTALVGLPYKLEAPVVKPVEQPDIPSKQ